MAGRELPCQRGQRERDLQAEELWCGGEEHDRASPLTDVRLIAIVCINVMHILMQKGAR